MDSPLPELATPQATEIYALLRTHQRLTALEISRQLHIMPNAVYRAAKQLMALGIVRKTNAYPTEFELVPSELALPWYLLSARRNFLSAFPYQNLPKGKSPSPSITFIKNRAALLRQTNRDATCAQHSIDFIVSGLEVPDETVLAYRKASARGVLIRALVQRTKETTREKLERWRDIGVDVKAAPDLGVRLFVFDSCVAYITAYSQESKEQALGVRFDYPPIAAVMSDLFTEHWTKGRPLS